MVQQIKYGNTNTFYISNGQGGISVDTDWAWTLSAFYKTIKSKDIKLEDIHYLIITHYHPDHMGLAGELVGDLDPIDNVLAYNENIIVKNSWNKILSYNLQVVFYGHANERDISRLSSIDDL